MSEQDLPEEETMKDEETEGVETGDSEEKDTETDPQNEGEQEEV